MIHSKSAEHIEFGKDGGYAADYNRPYGMHIVARRGHGKSYLLGETFVRDDVYRNIPTVVFDQVGETVNHFFTVVDSEMYERVRYVDMRSLNGYVMPFPLYYLESLDDTALDIANRLIEVISRTDPALSEAPIQGMNAIRQVGLNAGIILRALGLQITEVEGLLNKKPEWEKLLKELSEDGWQLTPEISQAINFFQHEYNKNQSAMFKSKLTDILLSPVNRAIFGASKPAINWSEVFSKNLCVLIDTSRETSRTMRAFKTLWVFRSLLSYIQSRGTRREKPISIVIDELASMYSSTGNLISDDMNELINVISRNYNIWLTIAHQEMYQFDELTQKSLMSMRLQLIGGTDDVKTAMMYAQRFFPPNPKEVKETYDIYGTSGGSVEYRDYDGRLGRMNSDVSHDVIDERNVYYTPEEQLLQSAHEFMSLEKPDYFFSYNNAYRTKKIEAHSYFLEEPPTKEEIQGFKEDLMETYGTKIEDIEAEIQQRISSRISGYEERRNNISEQPNFFDDIIAEINKQKEERKAKDNEDEIFR